MLIETLPRCFAYLLALLFSSIFPFFSHAATSNTAAIANLTEVERYLNGIKTMQANFKQTAANGEIRTGVVYLQKPGKLRWEYLQPTQVLIIGDNKNFTYYDADLDEVSYISSDSALGTFLTQEIRLNQTLKVEQYLSDKGKLQITLYDPKDEQNTEIVMHFKQMPLTLLGFSIVENGEQTATITFSGMQTGGTLNNDLFDFRNPRFFR